MRHFKNCFFVSKRKISHNDVSDCDAGVFHDVSQLLFVDGDGLRGGVGVAAMKQLEEDGVLLFGKHGTLLHDPAQDVGRLLVAQLIVLKERGNEKYVKLKKMNVALNDTHRFRIILKVKIIKYHKKAPLK